MSIEEKRLEKIKLDFPILSRQIHGRPLVYLDNAATSQKPLPVIEAVANYYQTHNANVHRGVHALADESTTVWLESRKIIAEFFGAEAEELILVRNTTEAINGVAYGWGDAQLHSGDVVLTTQMEHHSSLVVWQELCRRTDAYLEVIGVDKQGRLDLSQLELNLQSKPVGLLALPHVSNALGSLNPIREIVQLVRDLSPTTRILLDAAQSAPHLPVDFAELGVDFLAFSGHKMLGPMGSGGLFVRKEIMSSEEMRPWLFGGGMIDRVELIQTQFASDLADRFTAGTPDVASAVGLAEACHYLSLIGMKEIAEHDQELVKYALKQLSEVEGVELIGPTEPPPAASVEMKQLGMSIDRVGSVAFTFQGAHAHDVAQVLDSQGVAVRSGHHCTMPLHTQFGWTATTRASFQVYNSKSDIDALITGLEKVRKVLG